MWLQAAIKQFLDRDTAGCLEQHDPVDLSVSACTLHQALYVTKARHPAHLIRSACQSGGNTSACSIHNMQWILHSIPQSQHVLVVALQKAQHSQLGVVAALFLLSGSLLSTKLHWAALIDVETHVVPFMQPNHACSLEYTNHGLSGPWQNSQRMGF
jgi:hypothetical protein